jgi:hypothetical protein
MNRKITLNLVIIIFLTSLPFGIAGEENLKKTLLDDFKVVRISDQEKMAVIKSTDENLQIIKVGDEIGTNGKVTEITKGRIVIEELTDRGMETVIIRVENGDQSVERISRVVMDRGQLYAPSKKGTKEHEGKK